MGLKLQYLGWASFLFTTPKGANILTDPFLDGDGELGIPATPVDYMNLDIDLIAASHPAEDHIGQAVKILKNSPKTKVLGDHSTLIISQAGGVEAQRCELTTAGATYMEGDMKIKAFDACHIALGHLPDGGLITGEPLCYIMSCEGCPTVFFGGDTSITMDMKLWGEVYKPEVAIIGIGGVDLSGRSLDEMDPEDAAICCRLLGVKKVIPMHYRGEDYLARFKAALAKESPECQCVPMAYGETVQL